MQSLQSNAPVGCSGWREEKEGFFSICAHGRTPYMPDPRAKALGEKVYRFLSNMRARARTKTRANNYFQSFNHSVNFFVCVCWLLSHSQVVRCGCCFQTWWYFFLTLRRPISRCSIFYLFPRRLAFQIHCWIKKHVVLLSKAFPVRALAILQLWRPVGGR